MHTARFYYPEKDPANPGQANSEGYAMEAEWFATAYANTVLKFRIERFGDDAMNRQFTGWEGNLKGVKNGCDAFSEALYQELRRGFGQWTATTGQKEPYLTIWPASAIRHTWTTVVEKGGGKNVWALTAWETGTPSIVPASIYGWTKYNRDPLYPH